MRCFFFACVLLFSSSAATLGEKGLAAMTPSPELTIHVYDYASIPPEVLVAGEGEASRIFGVGHIRLIWVPHSPGDAQTAVVLSSSVPRGPSVILKILSKLRVARLYRPPQVLGFTIPGTSFVFFDRVCAASPPSPVSTVLGYVMAHELGHCLGLHHSVAIMSENVPRAWYLAGEPATFGFTSSQLSKMRDKLLSADGSWHRVVSLPAGRHLGAIR